MTDFFSRAATVEDLKELVRSLNDHGAEYILIGGYALHAHGYQRATTDIDLLVPQNREAGQRVKDALLVRMRPIAPCSSEPSRSCAGARHRSLPWSL